MTMPSIVGSLWRVKEFSAALVWGRKSTSAYIQVLRRLDSAPPWSYPYGEEYANADVRSLEVGELVLVSGVPVKASEIPGDRWGKFLRMVPIVMPVRGWVNDSYFTRDSLWLERIA